MDEFETYEDVIDAYNANNMGYSTLTDYIKGENIKIKEISMEPLADLQRSLFENKADGGMIGIEVLFREKNKKGGRVGYAQGGSRRSKYDSTGGGLASSSKSKNISPGPGGGGRDDKPVKIIPPFKLPKEGPVVVDSVSEMLTKETLPAGALEKFYKMNAMLTDPTTGKSIKHLTVETPTDYTFRRVTPDGITENDIPQRFGAPQSLSVDPYSNNIIGSELKNGGRVGLFMGGPPLEGQALSIYNSMKDYGATDQAIADRLSSMGLYTPSSSTPPETTQPNIIGSQINQGRDTGPTRPTSEIVADFQETITDRQKRLNDPDKIASFIGKFIPQQRSIADMLASGQVDTRMTGGIPLGIGSMIAKVLPDKYYDMSLADQITTQAYMGYTDPNTNIGNRDPFGLNVRSAFGNYAEKAAEIVGTLEEKLARRGELSKYDQARLDHYRNVTKTKQDAVADLGLINLAKEQQAEKDRIAKAATEAFYAAQGKSDPGDQSRAGASGRRPGSGGAGIATDSTGTSYDRGGREGFGYGLKDGGLATMFTRRR